MTLPSPSVEVYGKPECEDTARSRGVLDARGVSYEYFDVTTDDAARSRAEVKSGSTRAPVILIDGRTVLIEPNNEELARALS